MKTLQSILITTLMLSMHLSAADKEVGKGKPLFENSIVSTEFDFITCDDPSAFKSLLFLGQGIREMPDKRNDVLMAKDTFLFEASFHDGSKVKIWAHSSFGSMEMATRYALMLSVPLGKLPEVMRKKISHVVIHKGNETAFGESDGHFFVLYSENMETRVRNHDLEETVFHESVHATLESKYTKKREWLSAQKADDSFITKYAARTPGKEDLPESALFAYTVLKHPGRLPSDVEEWVHKNMPNRLAFFQKVFPKVENETNRVESEDNR
ncbi:hypothetical protein P3T73_17935 [Kiritimatiellota bacterium B12222]|nr:hypothetical protein P3T73_17935 [Kiritimatiellota bacterium B12222]